MSIVFKHCWIAFIFVTFANGAIWWHRGRGARRNDPSLADGYRSLIRGFVTWGNVPWVIMGAGVLFGGVPSVFHYFDPRSENPFVVGFFVSVVVIWIAGTYWLFARGGAEKLVRHPGLLQSPAFPVKWSPAAIKVFWLLCLAGGVAGITVMYVGDFQPTVL